LEFRASGKSGRQNRVPHGVGVRLSLPAQWGTMVQFIDASKSIQTGFYFLGRGRAHRAEPIPTAQGV